MEINSVNAEAVEVVAQQTPEVVESVQSEVATDKQSPEENSKYAAARKDAEAKAKALEEEAKTYKEKVSRIEQLAKKAGFDSIDVFTDIYDKQLQEQEVREKRERLEAQGIDPDVYEEMLSNDPRIKEYNKLTESKEQEERKQTEISEFLNYFNEQFGRSYDPATDKVSLEVEEMVSRGIPLVVAYKAADETVKLKSEIETLKTQLQANETNKRNASSTPGGLNGTPNDNDFISAETFEINRSNQNWVMKNLTKIQNSRPKW